ncbi:Protein FAR1-RELATED SEQUENCE 5 [Linum perenne]
MYEETTEGFKWVFNTFLECMKNKHSRTIFTDQCPAIAAGIRSVMPNTFHGLCIFHINENAKEKLKGKAAKDGIITDLNFLMKWVDTEDEFEARWQTMISKYYPDNLPHGHPWLVYIHKFRHQWSSVWVNNNFTAGMRSSQLSESLNSNLRPLLNTKKNLHQFFTQFNRLLESKRSDEEQLDFNVGDNLPIARYRTCPLVCQAAKVYIMFYASLVLARFVFANMFNHIFPFQVYTKPILEFFQNEFAMSLAYEPSSNHLLDNEQLKVFFWHRFDDEQNIWIDEHRVEVDIVSWKYRCPCHLFEFSGWLCCHILRTMEALKLLGYMQARTIPAFYLIDRWTRFAKIGLNYLIDLSPSSDPDTQVGRYYQLYSAFLPVSLEACVNTDFTGMTIKMVEDIKSYIRQTLCNRQQSPQGHPESAAGTYFIGHFHLFMS